MKGRGQSSDVSYLLIDTTVPRILLVGVACEDGIVHRYKSKSVPFHGGDALLSFLRSFLRAVAIKPEALDGVIVSKGPGAFTAVRIGVTLANAFSYGLEIPIAGVSLPPPEEKLRAADRRKRLEELARLGVRQLSTESGYVRAEYGKPPTISKQKKKVVTNRAKIDKLSKKM